MRSITQFSMALLVATSAAALGLKALARVGALAARSNYEATLLSSAFPYYPGKAKLCQASQPGTAFLFVSPEFRKSLAGECLWIPDGAQSGCFALALANYLINLA